MQRSSSMEISWDLIGLIIAIPLTIWGFVSTGHMGLIGAIVIAAILLHIAFTDQVLLRLQWTTRCGNRVKFRDIIDAVADAIAIHRATKTVWQRFKQTCVNTWNTVCDALRRAWDYVIEKLTAAYIWSRNQCAKLWKKIKEVL